MIDQHVSF